MTRPQTPPPGSLAATELMAPLDTDCERCGAPVTLYVRPGGTVAWVMNPGRQGLHVCRPVATHDGECDRAQPVRLEAVL